MANRTDYIAIIKSDEYKNKLKKMAQDIKNASKVAPNEATIESRFDCELFAFFKDMFEPLGFIYNPIKEKSINTARHISKGRADTAIASLVIEFKQPSTLSNKINKAKAISQISDYLLGLKSEDNKIVEGYVTNGVEGCFVTLVNGEIHEEDFIEINEFALDRIIQNILSLKLLAFNASNLVDSFCNPPENNGVAYELVRCLYNVLIEDIKPKTKMLFIEWKQLFNLAHDDISKQQAIIDRKKSLEELLGHKFSDRDDEYLSLYALQTAYAIIVKAIAFKVVSQVRFNKSLISFGESINQDSEALRIQFSRLEDGAIFRDYGMTNLLEGDFFSWYCAENQWNESIAKCIKNIFEILSRYSEKAVLNNTHKSQDFFKRLYEAMVPAAVRHSLGEYYTRKWLAENVVDEAIALTSVKEWKGLDPCCGSGTFLNVMIDRILSEVKDLSRKEQLKEVLSRVKGIDLNPITVLTARVNYFLNISHLLEDNTPIDIPVYLGDSSYVPETIKYDGIECLDYVITTTKKPIEITVPKSIVDDTSKLAQEMIVVERQVKNLNVDRVIDTFRKLIKKSDLTEKTEAKLNELAENLIGLERKNWNGIWARILANYLSTANLGKFDIIVGNPPWVDWKSLPSGYRDRIKGLCISRHLFSGDRLTGGINLNICALIANVSAQNWLKKDGIWARILANYLSTANLGKFDIIVGNPPWVDWKSLPSGYRDRIKGLCISRHLFSGDRLTGGINLNICALIANVSAQNWLKKDGILGFLMPEPLVFQPSYEGFRDFYLDDGSRLYFCKFSNWTKAGHPFKPVTQKFLSFYLSSKEVNYVDGVPTDWYIKKRGKIIDGLEELNINEYYDKVHKYLATCNENNNFFTSIERKEDARAFLKLAGSATYIGREGIEFYPQELMVFELSSLPGTRECTCLRNMQNSKSKYKMPVTDILLETKYLHPMIKGKDVTPFHVEWNNYIVPFPYEVENPRVPIEMGRLSSLAPKLAEYYNKNKKMILSQTEYNEKIIGNRDADFYALARVGEYSYATNYVVFRDNTKWAAAVISEVNTQWGGVKRPLFQNHAVSICEDEDGNFITLDEAHYICGILNSNYVYEYMMNSSDSRSFPIRPRVKIPKYDKTNKRHKEISDLSKLAHERYQNQMEISKIKSQIDLLYMQIL